MAFYNTCPICGANLDPGEPCNCESEREKRIGFFTGKMKLSRETGQYSLILDEKEPLYDTEIARQI